MKSRFLGKKNNQEMNPNMAQKTGKIKKATVSGDFSLIGVAKGGIEPPTSGYGNCGIFFK